MTLVVLTFARFQLKEQLAPYAVGLDFSGTLMID